MPKARIEKTTLSYLQLLKKNNNRDWFAANKDVYTAALKNLEDFAGALLLELGTHDLIETPTGKKSLHRIYRDTRFSSDKTPYKGNWSGNFRRATASRRGGYYFHIEPGNTFIAGGFWNPNPADIRRVRDELAFDPSPLRKILKSKSFVSTFGELQGEQLKTAPKGFDSTDPAIDLLRYKQFLLRRKFSDREVLDESFVKQASLTYKNMRPFFDYMSEVLTTDVNGISLHG